MHSCRPSLIVDTATDAEFANGFVRNVRPLRFGSLDRSHCGNRAGPAQLSVTRKEDGRRKRIVTASCC